MGGGRPLEASLVALRRECMRKPERASGERTHTTQSASTRSSEAAQFKSGQADLRFTFSFRSRLGGAAMDVSS